MNRILNPFDMDYFTTTGSYSRDEVTLLQETGRMPTGRFPIVGSFNDTSVFLTSTATLNFGTQRYRLYLVYRPTVTSESPSKVVSVATGIVTTGNTGQNSAYVTDSGRLFVVGSANGIGNGSSSLSSWTENTSITSVVKVNLGNATGGLVRTDGTLWTTGLGTSFRTGQGSTGTTNNWVNISQGFSNWENVMMGFDFGYGVRSSGQLYSWGNNANGYTGQGTSTGTVTAPTQVGSGTDWAGCKLYTLPNNAAASSRVVIQKADGNYFATGNGLSNALPITPASSNTLIPFNTQPSGTGVSFAMTTNSSYIVTSDGRLWGCGNRGAQFNGQTTSSVWVQIGTDTDWTDVYSQGPSLFMVKSDNSLWYAGNVRDNLPALGTQTSTILPLRYGRVSNDYRFEAGNQHWMVAT